ncbi:MAG: glycine--tRNA ligase [Nitrososphaerota archaeon]|nr:glycine--tRNA ligase [Nitrososphaerota archaeon]MDG7026050.1 glycine--tRNA ligase [Nitrososphaerota archaeon]
MSFDEIVRLGQQRGFFFKTAESYPNTPAGFLDYGPLGVGLKSRLVDLWRRVVVKRDGMLEIDGSQILPRAVFEASGHLSSFTDPFVKCAKCGSVFRPDKLIEEKTGKGVPEKLSDAEYDQEMDRHGVKCLRCGSKLSGTTRFNMMFRVGIGPAQEEAYLRPETCQSIFVDFPLLFKTQRVKLPVGIAQVGRSFRNEIAPRQALIRLRELNQAEVEVFFNPKKADDQRFDDSLGRALAFRLPDGKDETLTVAEASEKGVIPHKLAGHYLALIESFYEDAGIKAEDIRFRVLADEDRAFYSRAAFDLEVKLSWGWVELVACNYRGDFDLGGHARVSGSSFTVDDDGEKVLPHVFELSLGIDRSIFAVMESSMKGEGERRVMALRPYLSPTQVCVFPLVNKDGLQEGARGVYEDLRESFDAFYDESGGIGRRYARADEAGVPACVTYDYDSLKDGTVTLRDRDTRAQERVALPDLRARLADLTRYPAIGKRGPGR